MMKQLILLTAILALPIVTTPASTQQQRTGQDQQREEDVSVIPADTSDLGRKLPDTINPPDSVNADSLNAEPGGAPEGLPGDTIVGQGAPGGRIVPAPGDPTLTTPGVPPVGAEPPGGVEEPTGPRVGPRPEPGTDGTTVTPPAGTTGDLPTTDTIAPPSGAQP